MTTPAAAPPTDIYWTFNGMIDPDSMQRFGRWLPAVTGSQARLHLLFQSLGGGIGDGIWLHNLLRGFPRPLTIYNGGHIASIGVIAYVGAARRCVNRSATFLLHRTTGGGGMLTANRLRAALGSVGIDDDRTAEILRQRARLSEDHWQRLNADQDVIFTAEQAVEYGLADEIGDFTPPQGVIVGSFNVP